MNERKGQKTHEYDPQTRNTSINKNNEKKEQKTTQIQSIYIYMHNKKHKKHALLVEFFSQY